MKRILIAYASHSGSTQSIAQFLCDVFSTKGFAVEARPVSEVADLSPYEFIVAGGLLYRFGWHPDVARFLEKNLAALQNKKVALFVTGMHLVKTPQCDRRPYPVYLDPSITHPVWKQRAKTLFDGGSTLEGYLGRSLATIDKIKPVSLAFFAGKLDLRMLQWPEQMIMLLLMLLTGMRPGDYRNWDALHAWANDLVPLA